MLLGTLSGQLLGNLLRGKGAKKSKTPGCKQSKALVTWANIPGQGLIIDGEEAIAKSPGQGMIRAVESKIRAGQNFSCRLIL